MLNDIGWRGLSGFFSPFLFFLSLSLRVKHHGLGCLPMTAPNMTSPSTEKNVQTEAAGEVHVEGNVHSVAGRGQAATDE